MPNSGAADDQTAPSDARLDRVPSGAPKAVAKGSAGARPLADELGPPGRPADLIAVAFAVVEDLDLLDRALQATDHITAGIVFCQHGFF